MNWNFVLKLFLIFFVSGCAQVTSLNLQKHQFGMFPTRIVWIQVEGINPEHVALLKFARNKPVGKTAFENALCMGALWEYDLYNIRPSAYSGFMSQLTGKKNLKNSCEDYELKPIWKYISKENYKVGIFEGKMKPSQSLLSSFACKKKTYLDEAVLWSMNTAKTEKSLFHVSDKISFEPGKLYYDKSCKRGKCFTSAFENIKKTFVDFTRSRGNYLYLVRNFQYANAIKVKNIKQARLELDEINAILEYFQALQSKDANMLVLFTSSNALDLNFPKQGSEWKNFGMKKNSLPINHTKLVSSVFASGARAENFCGMYAQNEILVRMLSGAKQQGLEFSIINPFN